MGMSVKTIMKLMNTKNTSPFWVEENQAWEGELWQARLVGRVKIPEFSCIFSDSFFYPPTNKVSYVRSLLEKGENPDTLIEKIRFTSSR